MLKHKNKLLIIAFLGSAIIFSSSTAYFEISKNLDIFISLYKKVDELYVDEVDHSRIMRKGIDAMLSELDPYTVYYSESEVEDFKFQTTGTYAGIGARISKMNKQFVFTELYENGPAHVAELMKGDVLLEIDGKPLDGKNSDEMTELLKGEENTPVLLRLKRGENIFTKSFKRDEVKIDNISYSGMLNDKVGYVRFENFRMNAASDVQKKLEEMKKDGMEYFILDMRGNPGGLLKESVDLVNLFIEGNKLVVSTKGKNVRHSREYKTYKKPYDLKIPIAVLVDGGSASASEIVSGSIQDYDRGVVIGRTSFGKGLVQITQPISFNSQVKVTTSKYYTSSGRCIQRLNYGERDEDGNVPDVPDSLITEYQTANGRKVFDGAGIEPDITIKEKTLSSYISALESERMFFKFAVDYHLKNTELTGGTKFSVSQSVLADFQSFINTQKFTYLTKTDKKLAQVKETLRENKDSTAIAAELVKMEAALKQLKNADFDKNKAEIEEFLRLEIVSHYYLRRGKAEAALRTDKDVEKALWLFENMSEYQAVLQP